MKKGEPKVKIRRLTVSANLKIISKSGMLRRFIGEIRPVLRIRFGKSNIIGIKMEVKGKNEGGFRLDSGEQVFENGAKVLEIHVNPKNTGEAIALVKKLLESLPELKKAGFTGVYSYTPTEALIKIFLSKTESIGAIEVGVTPLEQKRTIEYMKSRGLGIPQSETAVKGVAIPLGDNIK